MITFNSEVLGNKKFKGIIIILVVLIPLLILSNSNMTSLKDSGFLGFSGSDINDFNVIIVSVDTLRADHLGSYGYSRNTSPSIDEFASSAILFEHATTQSSWTVPSYASLFTSTYVNTHKVTTSISRLSDKQETLAETLKKHGYRTVAFVENAGLDTLYGFDKGFDVYDFRHTQYEYDHLKRNWAEIELNDIREFLKDKGNDKFFLFIQLEGAHGPYLPNAPYDTMFDLGYNGSMPKTTKEFYEIYHDLCKEEEMPCDFGVLESLFWLLADGHSKMYIDTYLEIMTQDNLSYGEKSYLRYLTENKIKIKNLNHTISLYDGQIRETDMFFGRLMELLEEKNLMRNSIIILTADHGEQFYEHGHYDHGGVYEEVLHVPLILRYPNMPQGGLRIQDNVELVDVMPTIFDILDLPLSRDIKEQMEGDSFVSPVNKDGVQLETRVYSEANIRGSFKKSIRSEKWKLIYDLKTGESELYDMENDPGEQENVINNHTLIANKLENLLFLGADEFSSFNASNFTIKVNNRSYDVIAAKPATGLDEYPLVIYHHGGGYEALEPPELEKLAQTFADEGFMFWSIETGKETLDETRLVMNKILETAANHPESNKDNINVVGIYSDSWVALEIGAKRDIPRTVSLLNFGAPFDNKTLYDYVMNLSENTDYSEVSVNLLVMVSRDDFRVDIRAAEILRRNMAEANKTIDLIEYREGEDLSLVEDNPCLEDLIRYLKGKEINTIDHIDLDDSIFEKWEGLWNAGYW